MFPMKNKSRHDLHRRIFYCGQLHFLENDIGFRFRKKLLSFCFLILIVLLFLFLFLFTFLFLFLGLARPAAV